MRVRWSLFDQVLVSGANALTGVVLVRALGLHPFGVYSFVLLCVQLLAVPSGAAIIAPTMSSFDQRGSTSREAYLATILLHQLAYAGLVAALIGAAAFFFDVGEYAPPALIAAVCVATQVQDLGRRFLFVTDRPALAFSSDLIAYGVRVGVLIWCALAGGLTLVLVWWVVCATSVVALLPLGRDLLRLEFDGTAFKQITDAHRKTAGWLVGGHLAAWASDTSFLFLVVGAVLGPAQLGAARAVQTIVQVMNVLLQSLENFAPSSATRALIGGGGSALLDYLWRLGILGGTILTATTAALLLFADPIMQLVYGRTFPEQHLLIAIFGGFLILAHVILASLYGLRALNMMRGAFFAQAAVAVVALTVVLYAVPTLGLIGGLAILLLLRMVLAWILSRALYAAAQSVPENKKAGAQ